jgi:hypothetical protein
VSQFPGSNPTIRNTNHHYYPLLLLLPYLSQPSLAPFSARLGSIRISARIRIGSASKTSARIRIGLGRIRKAKERLGYMKRCLWARILADSEDCATFACIKPLCFEVEKHKCRGLKTAPWHNVTKMLDTAVCPQLSNRELMAAANTIAPWKLKHDVSF